MALNLYIVKIMTRTREAYHHGDLRTTLLQVGSELLEREGLDALTMRGVARAAGVSHAAPYHHFADKTALLGAIAVQGFEALDREITERGGGTAAADRLQGAAGTYVGFAVDHPELFRLMFSSVTSSPDGDPELRSAAQQAYKHITGTLPDESAAVAAWSIVHGLAMLLLDAQVSGGTPTRAEAEARALKVTAVLWRGLGAYV